MYNPSERVRAFSEARRRRGTVSPRTRKKALQRLQEEVLPWIYFWEDQIDAAVSSFLQETRSNAWLFHHLELIQDGMEALIREKENLNELLIAAGTQAVLAKETLQEFVQHILDRLISTWDSSILRSKQGGVRRVLDLLRDLFALGTREFQYPPIQVYKKERAELLEKEHQKRMKIWESRVPTRRKPRKEISPYQWEFLLEEGPKSYWTEEEVQEYAMSLLNLPTEIILELMDRMDEDLLASVCLTHPMFYDICQRDSIQRRLKLRIPGYRKALQMIQEEQTTRSGTLTLEYMDLKALPHEIGTLVSLQTLYLSKNQLTTLPREIRNLSSLQKLHLYGNQLITLPREIGNLSSLKDLNLYNNQLTSLPPEIGHLSSLQMLSLASNQLTSLPPEIGNLSSLRRLYLNDNNLTSLPSEIGHISSLELLDLSNNELTTLPPEIENMPGLTFYVSGNPILSE